MDVDRRHGGELVVITLPGGTLGARDAAEVAAVAHELSEQRPFAVVLTAHGLDFCAGRGDSIPRRRRGPGCGHRPRPGAGDRRGGRRLPLGRPGAGARLRHRRRRRRRPVPARRRGHGRRPAVLGWGTQRLPRAIGHGAALAILLGDQLDAARSRPAWCGAPPPTAAPSTRPPSRWPSSSAGWDRSPSSTPRRPCTAAPELPLRDGLRLEGDLNTLLATSADRAEGLAAFFSPSDPPISPGAELVMAMRPAATAARPGAPAALPAAA
ncbi:MAG: hypothetical protein R2755_04195 [Acidimicrobiales bacterium]